MECSIEGCAKRHYGRGWCNMHWQRWRKTGDPLGVRPSRPNSGSFRSGQQAWNKGVPMTAEARERVSAARAGQPAWNKGRAWSEAYRAQRRGERRSESTRDRIRAARASQAITPAHRAAIAAGLRGKPKAPEHVAQLSGSEHYRYRGATARNLSKKAWREVRARVLERDGWICQTCGEQTRAKLVVHHIVEHHRGGSDEPDNLVTWCRSCHVRHHSRSADQLDLDAEVGAGRR